MRNTMFQTPTRATDNKIPDGTYDAWAVGLKSAPPERTKGYNAAIMPIACKVNGQWAYVEKLLWLPADGASPSVDSELVQLLCTINGVPVTTDVDLSELADIAPLTVQIINEVTERENARGGVTQFHNPRVNAYLPRTPGESENLPVELRRDESGNVVPA